MGKTATVADRRPQQRTRRGHQSGDRPRTLRAFDLAERVRTLRQSAKLTLRELGLRSGISISTLSKVENGQLSPTYEKIVALARGLGVDTATLFAEESSHAATGRRSVTRKGQGVQYSTRNYAYELLCADLVKKRMIPLLAVVKAKEVKDFGPLLSHEGEEVIYVVQGVIVLHTEFYEPTELKAGDCAYLDSRMGHGCIARGIQDAIIFWVCSSEEVQDFVRRDGQPGRVIAR